MPTAIAERLALGQHRGDAAHGGADGDRLRAAAAFQLGGHRLHVACKIGKRIGAVLEPFGIAVAALINRIGGPASPRELSRRPAPGMAGLAATMQQ